jgi:uncharacterized membrane protein YbhN (UPF0104 family)
MALVKRFSPMALVKLAVSAALIGWCLRSVDLVELGAAFRSIGPRAALGCLAFLVAHTLLCAWRWRLVGRALGLAGPAPRDAVRWMAFSVTLSQVLPSTVGGDAYRIAALGRQEGVAAAARCVIHDRLSGLWVLAALAGAAAATVAIAAPAGAAAGRGFAAFGGLVLAFVAAVPLAAWIGVHAEASRLWRMVRSPAILATSLGIHAMTIAAVAVLCMGLQPGSPLWWQMALLTPAAMLAAAVPVSVGGWGVREAALVALAAAFAIPQSDALAVSIAFGLLMLANGVIGAVLWAADPGSSRRNAGAEAPRI